MEGTNELEVETIGEKLKAFWEERKRKKKIFYVAVVKCGLTIAVLALVLQYANFAVQNILDTPLSSEYFLMLQFFGIVMRVIGICIYSTVPCSEFDLCVELLIHNNRGFRRWVTITLGMVAVIGGIAVGKLMGSCLLYLTLVPMGVWMFTSAFTSSYDTAGDYVKDIRSTSTYRRIALMFQCDLVVLGLAPGYFSLYNYMYEEEGQNVFILWEGVIYITSALIIFTLALVGHWLRSHGRYKLTHPITTPSNIPLRINTPYSNTGTL